jgi:hypothetical protein
MCRPSCTTRHVASRARADTPLRLTRLPAAQFDYAMFDPPFITAPTLEKYARTIKLLLAPGGKILGCSLRENGPLLHSLLGVECMAFLPSVPNLVYQFNAFCNYDSALLSQRNPELPEEEA